MKKKPAAALLLALFACCLSATGQSSGRDGRGDLKTRVSSILERFPAETAAARDGLCAEILGLGPEAVVEVCRRLLPPDAGNDSQARFAVNGLVVYVTRPGAEKERGPFARALLASLNGNPDKQVAGFLLSQVQLAGKKESIKPVAKYLVDEALSGPAAAALQAIGGRGAARALLKSIDAAPRVSRLTIVKAFGEMRSREAVKRLLVFAKSGDEGLRRAALFALANIGDPAAGPVLAKTRVAAPSPTFSGPWTAPTAAFAPPPSP